MTTTDVVNRRTSRLMSGSLSLWGLVACLALAVGCSQDRGAIHALSCEEGWVRPLSDVPESEWPETIGAGLAAMMEMWQGAVSASLRCPERPDDQIVVTVRFPGAADLKFYAPPANVPKGSAYTCLDAAGGEGSVTVEGITVEGVPSPIQDQPFNVFIKRPETMTLVDGQGELGLSGNWQQLILNYGIAKTKELYGSVFLSRSSASGGAGQGEAMQCRMLSFVH